MRKLFFAFIIISVFTLSMYSCEDIEDGLDAIQENVVDEDEESANTQSSNREFEVAKAKLIESVQSQKKDMSSIFRGLQNLNRGLSDLSDNEKKLRLDTLTQDADSVLIEMNAMEGYIDDINLPAQEKHEARAEGGLVAYVPYVIIVALLIVLGVLFRKNSKSKKDIVKKLNRKIKDKESKIDDLNNDVKKLDEALKNAKRIVEKLKQKECKQECLADCYNLPDEINESSSFDVAISEDAPRDFGPQKIFVALPVDGIFKETYDTYQSEITLYQIETKTEDTATFVFYDDKETVDTVKDSRSRFLDVACIVENVDLTTYTSIETTIPGEVVRVDEGWRITKKAHVRLYS